MLLLGMCPFLGFPTQRTPIERSGNSLLPWLLSVPIGHASLACNVALMPALTPVAL